MMFVVQDFFKNFTAFVAANDTVTLCDLIVDEIAKIIVFDKGKMVEALKKVDNKVTDKITDSQMISAIIKYSKNEVFISYVARIISINNSEGHTISDSHTGNVKKALSMFLNPNNERLLSNKVKQHHKIKEMNFGTCDEAILLYNKKMTMRKVALWSTGIIILSASAYVGWRVWKSRKAKKGTDTTTSTSSTSTVNSSAAATE